MVSISNFCIILVLITVLGQIWSKKYIKPETKEKSIGYYYKFMNIEMRTCGYTSPKRKAKTSPRIINGDLAALGEFPWQVNILDNWMNESQNHICSGVLIHTYWVLTARHCVYPGGPIPILVYNISLGSLHFKKFIKSVGALYYKPYPLPDLDVALIRLSEPVFPVLTDDGLYYRINYICLPKQWILNKRKVRATASGFGWAFPNNEPRNLELRRADFTIDSYKRCEKYGYNQFYMCGEALEQRTCYGDSGSGLVQYEKDRAVVIGIVLSGQSYNRSEKCGPGTVDFLRVSFFIGFIANVIEIDSHSTHSSLEEPYDSSSSDLKTQISIAMAFLSLLNHFLNK